MGGSIHLQKAFGIEIDQLAEEFYQYEDSEISEEEREECVKRFVKDLAKHGIEAEFVEDIMGGVVAVKGTYTSVTYGYYSRCYGIENILSVEAENRGIDMESLVIEARNFFETPVDPNLEQVKQSTLKRFPSLEMEWFFELDEDILGTIYEKEEILKLL